MDILVENKKGWCLEDGIWWFYFGIKKPNRTRGVLTNCATCNKEIPYVPSNHKRSKTGKHFCSRKCSSLATTPFKRKGKDSISWKGGNRKNARGYILIFKPDYPGPKDGGAYVREHRLVMEEFLGRYLRKDELVHHKNGIKDDNRISNLEVLTYANHQGEVTCPCCDHKFKIK